MFVSCPSFSVNGHRHCQIKAEITVLHYPIPSRFLLSNVLASLFGYLLSSFPLLPHPTGQSYQFHSVQSYSTVTSSPSTPSKHNRLLSSPHLIPFSLSCLTSTPFHPCDFTVFHHISYRHFFAEIESQLFKEHECDDGLRSQSDPRW